MPVYTKKVRNMQECANAGWHRVVQPITGTFQLAQPGTHKKMIKIPNTVCSFSLNLVKNLCLVHEKLLEVVSHKEDVYVKLPALRIE